MRVTNRLRESECSIKSFPRRVEKFLIVKLEIASDRIQKTGRAHIRQPSHRAKHLGKRRHVTEYVQTITYLRHAKLAQIPVDVFDQMRDLTSAHLREGYGYPLWREFVFPIVFMITMVARQHVFQIEISFQICILNQLPNLLLNEREL